MTSKVWVGRRMLNVVLALVHTYGCTCSGAPPLPPPDDGGMDAHLGDDAKIDAGLDGWSQDAGSDAAGVDAGGPCDVVPGAWRFLGTGAPASCGMFEFVVTLATVADVRGSRECTTGCDCGSTPPVGARCEVLWVEACSSSRAVCTFDRVSTDRIEGRCDDGTCAVSLVGMPLPPAP